PAGLEREAAREENGYGGQRLQRVDQIGAPRGSRWRFAHQGCRTQSERPDRREPSRLTEPTQALARLSAWRSIVRGLGEGNELLGGVLGHPRGQGDVGVGEKGADSGRFRHGQTKWGVRFALNAS